MSQKRATPEDGRAEAEGNAQPQNEGSASPLDRATRSRGLARCVTVGLAVALHALVALGALASGSTRKAEARRAAPVTQMFEVKLEPPPEPEPEPVQPEPEPVKPPPKSVRRKATPAPKFAPEPQATPEPAPEPQAEPNRPAEAAKAADVLTAKTPEVVDFGNTIVVGNADQFAGGTTASKGTSDVSVRDAHAQADGVPGGSGKAVAGPDLSRPPRLAGGASWRDCGFPRAATFAGVDRATVTLHLTIEADGEVSQARTVDDPGHGFGSHAAKCARRKRWHPARGRDGKPTRWSRTLRVQFVR